MEELPIVRGPPAPGARPPAAGLGRLRGFFLPIRLQAFLHCTRVRFSDQSVSVLARIIQVVDVDRNRRIDFIEFCELMETYFWRDAKADKRARLKDVFDNLDADKSGYLDETEIAVLFRDGPEKMTEEEVPPFQREVSHNTI